MKMCAGIGCHVSLPQVNTSTRYIVGNLALEIHVGSTHKALDALHGSFNVTTLAFITVWNPCSQESNAEENTTANRFLFEDIKDYVVYAGKGVGNDPSLAPNIPY
jgi:hypothetical protein